MQHFFLSFSKRCALSNFPLCAGYTIILLLPEILEFFLLRDIPNTNFKVGAFYNKSYQKFALFYKSVRN